jgi:CheY-specific phosphatase CheX
MDLNTLSEQWLMYKESERVAIENRRIIEDKIMSLVGIPETLDGTENVNLDTGVQIKIVGRMNRKVDTDKLQDIAAEHGLSEHLHSLFRWKAEINTSVWKATSENITTPLMEAVTTTPGRPSFSILVKE